MSQQRSVVSGFDNFGGAAESRIDISNTANDFLRLVGGFNERFLVCLRLVNRIGPVLPVDFELLAGLRGGPGVVRNYRDTSQRLKTIRRLGAFNYDCLLNARDFACLAIVKAF